MVKNIYLNILINSLLIINNAVSTRITDNFYVGAVVEYANIFNESKLPIENIQNNVKAYMRHIKLAKTQGADIIVFPEYGLTSTSISKCRKEALLYSSEIPNPDQKINPCNINKNIYSFRKWSDILIQISCEAQRNKIYVVVNLPEKVYSENETILFNTDIVFNRKGTVISRYRKYNLFEEKAFNTTIQSEIESFRTNFGVKFGLITCFDILHSNPTLNLIKNKGITDILFPTAWMSKMPFLTAVQTQAGFANSYKVNLLASNYNDPKNYGAGSGIYSPISGILNYMIPSVKQSQLLVSKIPKLKAYSVSDFNFFESKNNNNLTEAHPPTLVENWIGFSSILLRTNLSNYSLCNKNLCCNFTINSTSEQMDYFYRLVAFDGNKSEGNKYHEQICGIVACKTRDIKSCGKISKNVSHLQLFQNVAITGNFTSDENFLHFPSTVRYNLSTLPFNYYTYKTTKFTNSTNIIKIKINKPVNKILGISIYGRRRLQ